MSPPCAPRRSAAMSWLERRPMTRVRHVGSGAVLASLAAGPLFLAVAATGELLDGNPIVLTPNEVELIAGAIWLAMIFGWFVAIVPNLLGALLMGRLGRDNVVARLPVMWSLAGAALGGGAIWLTWTGEDRVGASSQMAAVAALCALVCRARVRWIDERD